MPRKNKDTGKSKRAISRTPSPERNLKVKREENAPDALLGSGSLDVRRLSNDEFLSGLKPLKGSAPKNISFLVADHDAGHVYGLEGQKQLNASRLWCLSIDSMEWEHISIHTADVFGAAEDTLPFRLWQNLELFGPKEHRRLLIFAGQDANGKATSDMFSIDLLHKMWSQVQIEGGNVAPRDSASLILVHDYKLFIFGGLSENKWLKKYSLAVFDPSKRVWTWEIRDHELPNAFSRFTKIIAAPLYGGKKILAIGCSNSVQECSHMETKNIFTFDPILRRFDPDPCVTGISPQALNRSLLISGSVENEAVMWFQNGHCHEFWSYRAFPDSHWKRLLEVVSLQSANFLRIIACSGKIFVLMGGQSGVNQYLELKSGP